MKRFLLIVFIVFNSCISPIENKKPNVIIIITDDQGFGDLGINENPNIITPNIDQFGLITFLFRLCVLLLELA